MVSYVYRKGTIFAFDMNGGVITPQVMFYVSYSYKGVDVRYNKIENIPISIISYLINILGEEGYQIKLNSEQQRLSDQGKPFHINIAHYVMLKQFASSNPDIMILSAKGKRFAQFVQDCQELAIEDIASLNYNTLKLNNEFVQETELILV